MKLWYRGNSALFGAWNALEAKDAGRSEWLHFAKSHGMGVRSRALGENCHAHAKATIRRMGLIPQESYRHEVDWADAKPGDLVLIGWDHSAVVVDPKQHLVESLWGHVEEHEGLMPFVHRVEQYKGDGRVPYTIYSSRAQRRGEAGEITIYETMPPVGEDLDEDEERLPRLRRLGATTVDLWHVPKHIGEELFDSMKRVWNFQYPDSGYRWIHGRDGFEGRHKHVDGTMAVEQVVLDPTVVDGLRRLGINEFRVEIAIQGDLGSTFDINGEFYVTSKRVRVMSVTMHFRYGVAFDDLHPDALHDFIQVVAHEMTHARQAMLGNICTNKPEHGDPLVYYLQPCEVEAHVREIVTEARLGHLTFMQAVELLLNRQQQKLDPEQHEKVRKEYAKFYSEHYDGWEERPMTAIAAARLAARANEESLCVLAYLPEHMREEFKQAQDELAQKDLWSSLKREKVAEAHITLVYVGLTESSNKEAVAETTAEILAKYPMITLRARGLGCFPPGPNSNGRVPVFVDYEDSPTLAALVNELREALQPHIRPETHQFSRFQPHSTLGYAKGDFDEIATALQGSKSVTFPPWTLHTVAITGGDHKTYAEVSLGRLQLRYAGHKALVRAAHRYPLLGKLLRADVGLDTVVEHFTLYKQYLDTAIRLEDKVQRWHDGEDYNAAEWVTIKRELAHNLNALKLHEMFLTDYVLAPAHQTSTDERSDAEGGDWLRRNQHIATQLAERHYDDVEPGRLFDDIRRTALGVRNGWVVLYYDAGQEQLVVGYSDLHHIGHIIGALPVAALDMWEHAYSGDYGANKAAYIERWLNHTNWIAVGARINGYQRGELGQVFDPSQHYKTLDQFDVLRGTKKVLDRAANLISERNTIGRGRELQPGGEEDSFPDVPQLDRKIKTYITPEHVDIDVEPQSFEVEGSTGRVSIGVAGYVAGSFDENKARRQIIDAFNRIERAYPDRDFEVVSGLTDLGVLGIAYREAKRRGWRTVGVACAKARDYKLFPVEEKHIVGKNWGDESNEFLRRSDVLVKIGNGEQSEAEYRRFKGPKYSYNLTRAAQAEQLPSGERLEHTMRLLDAVSGPGAQALDPETTTQDVEPQDFQLLDEDLLKQRPRKRHKRKDRKYPRGPYGESLDIAPMPGSRAANSSGAPVGEVHEHADGTKWKKVAPGRWEQVHEEHAKPKRQPPGSQLHHEVQARLKHLGVGKLPQADIPAEDITVNLEGSDIHSRAVITWRDSKGRYQSGYTPQFHQANAQKKWERVQRFREQAPEIIKQLHTRIAEEEHGTIRHQGATIAAVVALTGLRPGSEVSLKHAGHRGVSTLHAEDVSFHDDGTAALNFIGKAGKRNTATISSPEVVRALRAYVRRADGGRLFRSTARTAACRELPTGMKLKDFRTIKAAETAAHGLAAMDEPPPLTGNNKKDKRLLAKALRTVSTAVSDVLNNTPAVARASYIPPRVFNAWARDVGVGDALWSELYPQGARKAAAEKRVRTNAPPEWMQHEDYDESGNLDVEWYPVPPGLAGLLEQPQRLRSARAEQRWSRSKLIELTAAAVLVEAVRTRPNPTKDYKNRGWRPKPGWFTKRGTEEDSDTDDEVLSTLRHSPEDKGDPEEDQILSDMLTPYPDVRHEIPPYRPPAKTKRPGVRAVLQQRQAAGSAARRVDLFAVPKAITKLVLDYVKRHWPEKPKKIGFHWTRHRKGELVVRVAKSGHFHEDSLALPRDLEEALRDIGIDDLQISVDLKRLPKREKVHSRGSQFGLQRSILRVLKLHLIVNNTLEFSKVKRHAMNRGTSVLGHEMTHARQSAEGTWSPNVSESEKRAHPLKYYLQPVEVEAHVREVVNKSRMWGSSFERELRTYLGYAEETGRKLTKGEKAQITKVYTAWFEKHYNPKTRNELTLEAAQQRSARAWPNEHMDVLAVPEASSCQPPIEVGIQVQVPKDMLKLLWQAEETLCGIRPMLLARDWEWDWSLEGPVEVRFRHWRDALAATSPEQLFLLRASESRTKSEMKQLGFEQSKNKKPGLWEHPETGEQWYWSYESKCFLPVRSTRQAASRRHWYPLRPPEEVQKKSIDAHHVVRLADAPAHPHEHEEGEETGKQQQRNKKGTKHDPFPSAFRKEMEAKGKQFKSPKTGNKIMFGSLPYEKQKEIYHRWMHGYIAKHKSNSRANQTGESDLYNFGKDRWQKRGLRTDRSYARHEATSSHGDYTYHPDQGTLHFDSTDDRDHHVHKGITDADHAHEVAAKHHSEFVEGFREPSMFAGDWDHPRKSKAKGGGGEDDGWRLHDEWGRYRRDTHHGSYTYEPAADGAGGFLSYTPKGAKTGPGGRKKSALLSKGDLAKAKRKAQEHHEQQQTRPASGKRKKAKTKKQ